MTKNNKTNNNNTKLPDLTFELQLTIESLKKQLDEAIKDIENLKTSMQVLQEDRDNLEDALYKFMTKHREQYIAYPLESDSSDQDYVAYCTSEDSVSFISEDDEYYTDSNDSYKE